jgi:hypothetical protein
MTDVTAKDVLDKCTVLRAFLSIDIIDSTYLKQKGQTKNSTDWVPKFLNFFASCRTEIKNIWEDILKSTNGKFEIGEEPELWKSLGDELIFTKLIAPNSETYACLSIIELCNRLAKSLREKDTVDVKMTIWLAGFPINNYEYLPLEEFENLPSDGQPSTEITNLIEISRLRKTDGKIPVRNLDFFGPSIDLGFRLSKFSSRRRLVISADFAYIVSGLEARVTEFLKCFKKKKDEMIHFHFHGMEELKGVNDAQKYPIIWIDIETDESKKNYLEQEDTLLNQMHIHRDKINSFLEEFLDRTSHVRMEAYTIKLGDTIGQMPTWHEEKRASLLSLIENEIEALTPGPARTGDEEIPKSSQELVHKYAGTKTKPNLDNSTMPIKLGSARTKKK